MNEETQHKCTQKQDEWKVDEKWLWVHKDKKHRKAIRSSEISRRDVTLWCCKGNVQHILLYTSLPFTHACTHNILAHLVCGQASPALSECTHLLCPAPSALPSHSTGHWNVHVHVERGGRRGGERRRRCVHAAECSRSIHKYYFLGKSKLETQSAFPKTHVVIAKLQYSQFSLKASVRRYGVTLQVNVYIDLHTHHPISCELLSTDRDRQLHVGSSTGCASKKVKQSSWRLETHITFPVLLDVCVSTNKHCSMEAAWVCPTKWRESGN